MIFTTGIPLLALASIAAASPNPQYGYGPPPSNGGSSSSSSAAAPASTAPADTAGHMNIQVGFDQTFTFHPNNITAPNGTLVTFFFPSGIQHSVTQSSFDNPCTHLAASGSSPAGFDSGLQTGTQFTINITDDTTPVYFHCKAPTHCGLGMVGAINPPTSGSQTFSAFLSAASAIGGKEATESDSGFASGGIGAVATGTAAASSAASSSSSGSSSSDATRVVVGGLSLFMSMAVGVSLL